MMEALNLNLSTSGCAAAAALAASFLLVNDQPLSVVEISLPRGVWARVPILRVKKEGICATAAVLKPKSEDADITIGAIIEARIKPLASGAGVHFRAGSGVGIVTNPGLALPIGEAAINPGPRRIIAANLAHGDWEVTISIEGGEELARQTLNPRLGIMGGLSILGSTGLVQPYSKDAWLASLVLALRAALRNHSGHIGLTSGKISGQALQDLHQLPPIAVVEAGDMLPLILNKLAVNPPTRLSLGGGAAKLLKFARGEKDLHSQASSLNENLPISVQIIQRPELAQEIAQASWIKAREIISCSLDVTVFDNQGKVLAHVD